MTSKVREALRAWLRRRKKERRRAEIAAFAAEYAGTSFDLDRALEQAGIEVIEAES
jgi:Arc/MetJ-type ribon-helix-helix transcriptional regulator